VKQFQFPLDRVRRWRAGQAALEELKLEHLREQLTRLREEGRRIEAERENSQRELLGQPTMEATDLQSLDLFRLHARNKMRDIESQALQVEAQANEQRRRVVEARRNADLLERLKQKALGEWQAASSREQETFATELFLARRIRKRQQR
jgi:hypothetical protein